jgi:tetratricopeptide (TPR) repeat protein
LRPADTRDIPKIWHHALRQLVPDRIAASDSSTGDEVSQLHLLEAVTALCATLAQKCPLVLFLDDVHWVDESTAAQLEHLQQGLSGSRFLLLIALRPGEISTPLQRDFVAALTKCSATVIRLGELDRQEAGQLFDAFERATGGWISAINRDAVYSVVGGRPFFILELLKSIRASHDRPDGPFMSKAGSVPEAIERALSSQLATLSIEALNTLYALAVAGGDSTVSVLLEVVNTSAQNLVNAVDELITRGFVVESDHGLRLAHDLLREAVLVLMRHPRKVVLHSRIAEVLAKASPSSFAEIANHYMRAGLGSIAFPYKIQASRTALNSEAYGDAEVLAREAAQVASTDSQRNSARQLLVEVLCAKSRFVEARAIVRDAGRAGFVSRTQCISLELIELLGLLTDSATEPAKLLTIALDLVERASTSLPPNEYAELLRGIAQGGHGVKDLAFWRTFLRDMRRRGYEIDDPQASSSVLSACSCVEAMYLNATDALSTAYEARQRAERAGRKLTLARSHGAQGTVFVLAGSLQKGIDSLEAAVRIAQQAGHGNAASAARNNLAVAKMEQGRWREALDLLEIELRDSPTQHRLFSLTNIALCLQGLGNQEKANNYCHLILNDKNLSSSWWARGVAHSILGSHALTYETPDRVAEHARHVRQAVGNGALLSSDCSHAESFLAKVAALTGNVDDGIERVTTIIERMRFTHFFAVMRLEIARAELVALHDRAQGRAQLADVRDRAQRMGAHGLFSRTKLGSKDNSRVLRHL